MVYIGKVFMAITKVLARPLVTQLKRMAQQTKSEDNRFRSFLVNNGRKIKLFELRVSNKVLKKTGDSERLQEDIPEEQAIDAAIDFFLEFVVLYGILVIVAVYEIYTARENVREMKNTISENKARIIELERENASLQGRILGTEQKLCELIAYLHPAKSNSSLQDTRANHDERQFTNQDQTQGFSCDCQLNMLCQ
eukprot:TRINITY_DN20537_c0_g1_i1.p2 TRINITY_DN20537_c0_g1~~TRINITY_DN20537_c0_g1_i1.p2  ORF type:complete len:195 (-),score=10.90 TRINITY_DN20537_c0_g1_i1:81-665(-)